MQRYKIILLVLFTTILSTNLVAAGHPLFPGIKDFGVTYEEVKEADVLEIPINPSEKNTVYGKKTFVQYELKSSNGPNPNQILGYYYQQIKHLTGTPVLKGEGYGVFTVDINKKEFWLVIEVYNNGKNYSLLVLETEHKELEYDRLLETLNNEGHIALYINFETGSSDLPVDIDATLLLIEKLLNQVPNMRLLIEGHTDNVGNPENNKELSTQRANSVMSALIKRGIPPSRLKSVGFGQEHPVASNNSPEGRKKNRRVELVKK